MKYSELRQIFVQGPETENGPIFEFVCDVVYDADDDLTNAVDRIPALRSMGLNPPPENHVKIALTDEKGIANLDFLAPSLMRARVDQAGHRSSELKPPIAQTGATTLVSYTEREPQDLVLVPAQTWPVDTHADEIFVPPLRLAAGEISLRLKADGERPAAFAKFLDHDSSNHTVFGGWKLFEAQSVVATEGLLVRLVPGGVELDVQMPNPLHAMTREGLPDIPARIRVEPDGDAGYLARVVRSPTSAQADVLQTNVAELGKAFDDLERADAPLRIGFNTELTLPPYLWLLEIKNGRLSASAEHDWRLKLAPENLSMRLETGIGPNSTRSAIARINLQAGAPALTARSGTVEMDFSTDLDTPRTVTAQYRRPDPSADVDAAPAKPPFALSALTANASDVYLPLHEAVARERRAKRRALGITDETRPVFERDSDLFLMLESGVLQVTAMASRPKEDVANASPQSAFEGGMVFGFESAALEVDRAAALTVTVIWANTVAERITVSVGGVSGGLRNAVWMALESPSSERLLPTGNADPAMSREIIAVIGGSRQPNVSLTVNAGSTAPAIWELHSVTGEDGPAREIVHWTAASDLPLVSSMPMLSLGDDAAAPSDLRNLVPRGIDARQPWSLRSTAGDGLPDLGAAAPAASGAFVWPWPDVSNADLTWGRLAIAMVNPLAPGVDYSLDTANGNTHAALRFDLPILDEFFAGLSADDLPDQATPDTRPRQADLPEMPSARHIQGVLSQDAMQKIWSEQTIKLGLSRTQMAQATGWTLMSGADTETDAGTDGPGNLVRGMAAAASVRFPPEYALNDFPGSLNLGSYAISWDGQTPEHYHGEAALLGVSGEFRIGDNVISMRNGGTRLRIEGFATALYPGSDGIFHDANRTGFEIAPALDKPEVVDRVVKVTAETEGMPQETLKLHSLVAPIDLGNGLLFWVRDLPLKDGVFEAGASPLESFVGPTVKPFQPGNAALSLYEWRIGREPDDHARPAYWFEVGRLRYWPIRLLHYQPGVRLKILCRAELARELDDDPRGKAHFQSDHPYDVGQMVEWSYDLTNEAPPKATAKRLLKGSEMLTFATDAPRLTFALTAVITTHLAGAQDPPSTARQTAEGHPMTLSAILTDDGALDKVQLSFSMLGQKLSVELKEHDTSNGQNVTFRLKAPSSDVPRFGVRLHDLTLDLSRQDLQVWLVGGVPIDRLGGIRPMALLTEPEAEPGQYRTSWLGLGGITLDRLDVDHERGTLQLSSSGEGQVTGSPVAGLPIDEGSLEMAAVLILTPRSGTPPGSGAWGLDMGRVTAKLVAVRKLDSAETRLVLYSSTRIEYSETGVDQPGVATDIRLDWNSDSACESGIVWDPSAIKNIHETHTNLGDPSSVIVEIEGSAAENRYVHRVKTALDGHVLAAHLLVVPKDATDTVQLADEIPVTLFAEHEVAKADSKSRLLYWAALEPAVLTQGRLWTEGHDPGDTGDEARVFGPRYKYTANKYRGEIASGIAGPGIGTRREMLGGFDDRAIWDNAAPLPDHDPIVLIGGGPGLVHMDEKQLVFGLPWVIPFMASDLPDALSDLMAFDTTRRRWRAAGFDATLTTLKDALLDVVRPLPPEARDARSIDTYLKKNLLGKKNTRYQTMARMVEQTFVEAEDDTQSPPARTIPIFLHALMALRSVLSQVDTSAETVLSVMTFHPIRGYDEAHQTDSFAGLTISRADPSPSAYDAAPAKMRRGSVELVALRRGGTDGQRVIAPDQLPANLGDGVGLSAIVNLHGPARLRKMAETVVERPDAALLVERDADEWVVAVWGISLLPEPDAFGTSPGPLTHPEFEVYPSPALGWPELPWAGDKSDQSAARLAIRGGDDDPVVSAEAGLSARSAAFSLAAPAATAERTEDARYLATQARALFEHGSSANQMILPGAPARHLQILPPRVRTPLWAPREQALRDAGAEGGGKAARLADTVGVLPLGFSRSLVGERPGIFETMIDCVLQDGHGERPDTGGGQSFKTALHASSDAFGRAATVAPVIMRQMRIPRSPALPVGQVVGSHDEATDPDIRRRTYVSFGDLSDAGVAEPRPDPLANHLARPVPASFWRGVNEGQSYRIVLDLLTETLDAPSIQAAIARGRGLDARLNARVLGDGTEPLSDPETIQALQRSGLLPSSSDDIGREVVTTLDVWLSIGSRRYDAAAITIGQVTSETDPLSNIDEAECIVPLTIEFPTEGARNLVEELVEPDPDERAVLHVAMREQTGDISTDAMANGARFEIVRAVKPEKGEKNFKLLGGLPRVISLGLGRRPSRRLSRPVKSSTYLFSDPAFDRALTTTAGQSNIVRPETGDPWLLALDRVQYDASSTMFLAFGRIDPVTGGLVETKAPGAATLTFRATCPGMPGAVDATLGHRDAAEKYEAQERQAYAIPISWLTTVKSENAEIDVPAGSKLPPGTKIEIEVSGFLGQNGQSTGTLLYVFTLAEKIEMPSPAAVYSMLRLDGAFSDGDAIPNSPRIVLHRTSPKPSRTDFPDLLNDLARGSVRRSAVFEWPHRSAGFAAPKTSSFLIKTDRSGGAQLPVYRTDFQTLSRHDQIDGSS